MNYLISTLDKLTAEDIDYIKTNYPVRYLKASKLPKEDQFSASVLAYILLIKIIGAFKEEDVYYNEFGKPYIKNKPFFNISHSGQFVVVVSDSKEIGVDIQEMSKKNIKLERFFTKEEQDYINEMDTVLRFHELWSKKEAAVKLIGTGLTTPFSEVEIISRSKVKVKGNEYKTKTLFLAPGYSLCFCYQE